MHSVYLQLSVCGHCTHSVYLQLSVSGVRVTARTVFNYIFTVGIIAQHNFQRYESAAEITAQQSPATNAHYMTHFWNHCTHRTPVQPTSEINCTYSVQSQTSHSVSLPKSAFWIINTHPAFSDILA